MTMMLLVTFLAGILTSASYRVGGMSKEEAKLKIPWFPQVLVKGWFRDVNCTLVVLGWHMLFFDAPLWAYGVSYLLMHLAMTTYWDDKSVNWAKPKDNFYLHGIFIALALSPLTYFTHQWFGLVLRTGSLGLIMGVLSWVFSEVDVEEYGRGVMIGWTLPILFAVL